MAAGCDWFAYQMSAGNFCNRMEEKMEELFNFVAESFGCFLSTVDHLFGG